MSTQGQPYDVCIAILVRDAGALLPRLLDAVLAQETPQRLEILAVDSGSTDGSLDVLRRYPVRLIEIPSKDFNWGRTRDFAYRQSSAPVMVNLSQDAIPMRTDWLDNLIRPLSEPAVGCSCGSSLPDPERVFPQFPWERNGYFYFTRETRRFVAQYGRGLSFANSAVPRAVWAKLRFDEQPTGEDFQFQRKLHGAGLRIAFPEDAPVLHHHNYTFGALWRRCRNEGYALKFLGCPYSAIDTFLDLTSPRKYVQWLREIRYGRLHTAADLLFPIARPLAIYMGSRFTRRPIWY